VEKLLKDNQAAVNAFTMFVVGEGIEKKVEDYAAEVAAAAAAIKG
jgi:elongation factor Ts